MLARVLTALASVLLSLSYQSHATALIPTDQQSETLRALIEKLEDSHYVDRRYNDVMSREHLKSYLERLDPSHLYFTTRDIADFDRFATVLDDHGRKGDVTASFDIFNRYEALARERLDEVIDTMDARVNGFDFEVDEFIGSDPTERDWLIKQRKKSHPRLRDVTRTSDCGSANTTRRMSLRSTLTPLRPSLVLTPVTFRHDGRRILTST